MDHSQDMTPVDGPWTGGWLIAVGAGLFVAWVAAAIGEVGVTGAAMAGGLAFVVFGVLLGSGGVELTAPEAGDHPPAHDHH